MARYGYGQADPARVRRRFLTTASVPKLLPLLGGLGQHVSVETDARGKPNTLNHVLKVFRRCGLARPFGADVHGHVASSTALPALSTRAVIRRRSRPSSSGL
jgi:hypothetical protein